MTGEVNPVFQYLPLTDSQNAATWKFALQHDLQSFHETENLNPNAWVTNAMDLPFANLLL